MQRKSNVKVGIVWGNVDILSQFCSLLHIHKVLYSHCLRYVDWSNLLASSSWSHQVSQSRTEFLHTNSHIAGLAFHYPVTTEYISNSKTPNTYHYFSTRPLSRSLCVNTLYGVCIFVMYEHIYCSTWILSKNWVYKTNRATEKRTEFSFFSESGNILQIRLRRRLRGQADYLCSIVILIFTNHFKPHATVSPEWFQPSQPAEQ